MSAFARLRRDEPAFARLRRDEPAFAMLRRDEPAFAKLRRDEPAFARLRRDEQVEGCRFREAFGVRPACRRFFPMINTRALESGSKLPHSIRFAKSITHSLVITVDAIRFQLPARSGSVLSDQV